MKRLLIALALACAAMAQSTAPALLYKIEAKYTDDARERKIEGTVRMSLDVGTNGKPANIRLLTRLDPGLDANAIDAVKHWRFRPAVKDGAAVVVQAQAEVTYRLPGKGKVAK